jgi:hypothetical protein
MTQHSTHIKKKIPKGILHNQTLFFILKKRSFPTEAENDPLYINLHRF